MGENFEAAGFHDVEEMVAAMTRSEDAQLAAMRNFLVDRKLRAPLQAHDWTAFARGYNGRGFASHQYDVRLNAEFQKLLVGVLPDLNIRAVQLYLTYLGFHPGPIDGLAGKHTLSALAEFQAQNGVQPTNIVDETTVGRLRNSLPSIDDVPNAA